MHPPPAPEEDDADDTMLVDTPLDDDDAPPTPPSEVEPPCHSSRPRIWAQAPPPNSAGTISHSTSRSLLPIHCDFPTVLTLSRMFDPATSNDKLRFELPGGKQRFHGGPCV